MVDEFVGTAIPIVLRKAPENWEKLLRPFGKFFQLPDRFSMASASALPSDFVDLSSSFTSHRI